MKYFILVFYFFRSLLLRGPVTHFRILIGELTYDKKLGIRTGGFKTSSSIQNFHYQGAAYILVIKFLNDLFPVTSSFHFADIGCGKGRVMIIAAKTGYKRILGIELDSQLLDQANENTKSYSAGNSDSEFLFLNQNAQDANYSNFPTVYFLFNPFGKVVMENFLERVMNCTHQETYFVYMNPRFAEVFSGRKIPVYKIYRSFLYTEAIVYRIGPKP